MQSLVKIHVSLLTFLLVIKPNFLIGHPKQKGVLQALNYN